MLLATYTFPSSSFQHPTILRSGSIYLRHSVKINPSLVKPLFVRNGTWHTSFISRNLLIIRYFRDLQAQICALYSNSGFARGRSGQLTASLSACSFVMRQPSGSAYHVYLLQYVDFQPVLFLPFHRLQRSRFSRVPRGGCHIPASRLHWPHLIFPADSRTRKSSIKELKEYPKPSFFEPFPDNGLFQPRDASHPARLQTEFPRPCRRPAEALFRAVLLRELDFHRIERGG